MGGARGTRQLGLLFVLSYASVLFLAALRRRYMRQWSRDATQLDPAILQAANASNSAPVAVSSQIVAFIASVCAEIGASA
jgi:hypothetical protein